MWVCEICGRQFQPGTYQANICRAFRALALVALYPGLTAWGLAQKSEIVYAEISEGLTKARANSWVGLREEQREQGGIRYRYFSLEPDDVLVAAKARHRADVARMAGTLV